MCAGYVVGACAGAYGFGEGGPSEGEPDYWTYSVGMYWVLELDNYNFVRWAHRRGLCGELEIANRVQGWPTRQHAPGAQEQIIQRVLTDDTISLVDRVSGLLVGCYGQLPARLVRLTIDDITIDGTTVTIRFGRDRVELVEPVAVCVTALIETRRGRSASDTTAASRWLFPGGFAGRRLDPETLANRLRRLGISAAKLRTDVLLELAADIPPAILADLIGLYPTTAARWTHAAGGDWAVYAAERVRATPPR
jgi:integrase